MDSVTICHLVYQRSQQQPTNGNRIQYNFMSSISSHQYTVIMGIEETLTPRITGSPKFFILQTKKMRLRDTESPKLTCVHSGLEPSCPDSWPSAFTRVPCSSSQQSIIQSRSQLVGKILWTLTLSSDSHLLGFHPMFSLDPIIASFWSSYPPGYEGRHTS